MSSINFKYLVETLLTESLADDLTPPVTQTGVPRLTFDGVFAKAEKYAFEIGKYERNDTIFGFRPDWPYIDVLGYIYRLLVDNNLLKQGNVNDRENFKKALRIANNAEEILNNLSATLSNEDVKAELVKRISDKIDSLKDIDNYKNYFITRFKQLNDKTAELAAEDYLNLSPFEGIVQLLNDYGGYDTKLIKKIIFYPGESTFTQKINIEGPIIATIIEISKLMLVFYREYIIEQKTEDGTLLINSLFPGLKINNLNTFNEILKNSAGKQNANSDIGRQIQQDYINFTKGQSKLIINPENFNEPIIKVIADFRDIAGTSQDIFQSFLQLFNNIKKGTHLNKWQVAGKVVYAGTIGTLKATKQLMQGLAAFSGHSLYGGPR